MAPRHNDLESEISKYIGQTFASWMSPDSPPFAQEYAKPPYINKLVGGIIDIVNGGGINEHHGDEDFPGKDLSAWDLLDKLKKQPDLYNKVEDFMKSMDSEPSKANDSMWTSTSTSDAPSDEKEKTPKAKPNWRDFRENTTGTSASVVPGAGEAFASPNAFKKKRK